MKRFGFAAIAVFMVIATLTLANPTQVHAGGCNDGYVSGNFNLAAGCAVSGDVQMDNQVLYDNDPLTGLVVTCARQNGCFGYAPYGASVSGESSDVLAARMRSNGCGTGYGCPRGVSQISWSGQQPVYQPPVYAPPVYQPPVYVPSGTQTGWGNASITIGASGTYSWIVINALPGQTFTGCWFPSTPPGGGSAINAVPNLATVSNPPPTSLPLCGPFTLNGVTVEIRSKDWYPGQWMKVQGIAIALNPIPGSSTGSSCNSGNCTVDSSTAASVGGRVWYLAPAGSADSSASPFTPYYAASQPPAIVFQGTTETPVR